MAMGRVLSELAREYRGQGSEGPAIEVAGGVEVARRVEEGEAFDLVFLSSEAIEKLEKSGRIVPGSSRPLVRSSVAAAVRAGAPKPDIGSGEALKRTLLQARSIGYSTGPSGVALLGLLEGWGLREVLEDRLVQAPPSVPVGGLLARGEVELGFQQLSELLPVEGISILGCLPAPFEIITVFAGALCAAGAGVAEARRFLEYLTSSEIVGTLRLHGLEPA